VERQDDITRRLVEEGWDRTVVESIAVVHESEDKVHIDIEHTRRRADGAPYTRFRTLWVATCQDAHWGIQFRSSDLTSDASTLGPPG